MADNVTLTAADRPTARQLAIIFAVLMAAAMTTYYERLFQTSLPDMLGIWGLSHDEGAILKTCAIAPQMLLAPVAPWLVMVFGVRRVLLPAALLFIFVSSIIPLITGFIPLLSAHIVMGALLGCFITATIMIMTGTLPGKWWLIPLAIHIFRLSVTTNTGVSVSGLYVDYLGWEWIYWQSALIMIMYIVVLFLFIPRQEVKTEILRKADPLGMVLLCLGTTMVFAAFDQGERLGWFHSGFVTVFMGGGVALLVLFLLHEWTASHPFAPLKPLGDPAVVLIIIQCCLCCVAFAGNQVLIIQFLSKIHALKPWQTGQALLAMVGIQCLFMPLVVWLNRNVDFRLVVAIGLICLAAGCHQGTLITPDWMAGDFLPMGVFFAFGTPMTVFTLVAACFSIFGTERSAGLVPYFQCVRVLLPYCLMALFSLFIRRRTDIHLEAFSRWLTPDNRVAQQFIASFDGTAEASVISLAESARLESASLAFQDAFSVCFWAAITGLGLLVFSKPAPYTPFTPVKVGPRLAAKA